MKRILVVDDNRLERRIIIHILKEHFANNIIIDEAPEGLSAVNLLFHTMYDLVITDLIMPKLEGLELIRKIKSEYPSLRVIAISGGKPFYLYLAKKMGIEGVFTKPIDRERFIFCVQETLNLSREKSA